MAGTCIGCPEGVRARRSRYCQPCLNETAKRERRERRERGLCVHCTKAAEGERSTCAVHAAYAREAKKRHLARVVRPRIKAGLCRDCGVPMQRRHGIPTPLYRSPDRDGRVRPVERVRCKRCIRYFRRRAERAREKRALCDPAWWREERLKILRHRLKGSSWQKRSFLLEGSVFGRAEVLDGVSEAAFPHVGMPRVGWASDEDWRIEAFVDGAEVGRFWPGEVPRYRVETR